MQINRFKTRRFAGLRDIELEFSDGLSIILGPNEAGKSTLVEALRLGLISPVSLKGQDKIDFEKRFMPLYGGDSVDLELTVGTPKGSLRLFKTFGNRPSAQLEVGQGAMVSRETLVYQQLNSIFGCGEKTIDTLVFGRQGEFQNLFAQVTAQDLAKGLSMVLHQAVLEMDGISVKLLENRIKDEVDGLLNRWDLDKGCPEGGRSIERPYHKGVGKVLDTFYQREQLGQQMKQVLQTEQRLSALAAQNQELTIAIIAKQQEIKTLAELEDDMIHRLELEPLAQSLAEQLAAIEADNQEWPVAQHNLQRCQDRLAEACTRLSLLKVEEEHSRAREEHRVLRELLTSVEKCRTQEETLLAEATTITVISEAQLGELETMSRHMEDLKVALRAARMQTNLKLAPGVEGKLICDFDEVEITDGHQNYTAEGYLRLEIAGVVIFEVQSGESNYAVLKQEYEECRSSLGGLMLQIGLENLDDARYAYRRMAAINREVDGLRVMATLLLAGRTLEVLHQEMAVKESLPPARPLPEVLQEQTVLRGEERQLRLEIDRWQGRLNEWQAVYVDGDGVAERLAVIGEKHQQIINELNSLSDIPSDFANAAHFRTYLANCRQEEMALVQAIRELQIAYREEEASLGAEGYEDLRRQYDDLDQLHQRLIAQARVLLRVKSAFVIAEQEVKHQAEKPLMESFARQVAELTGGRYGVVGETGFLEFSLQHQDEYSMPLNLLSAGTLDSVALAFRFALLDKLFPDGGGMVVLDDCLVDLDPERRARAATMIKKWARNNQVIYVTCDPATAELLGGQIVRLG